MEKAAAFPHLVTGQGEGHRFIAHGRLRWVWKLSLGRFPEDEGGPGKHGHCLLPSVRK